MSLRLNDIAPDFRAETTQGTINFHEWIGNGWAVLFSHPKDFTPVCTTELGSMAQLEPEFKKRNARILALSVDPVESHLRWRKDIQETQGSPVNYPIIGDTDLAIAKLYDMLPADETGTAEGRTSATNQTVRCVFIIGPDKRIKLMLTYPMNTGRNFPEILRTLDSMQLTVNHKVATPANWKFGEDVIIMPSVSDAEAKEKYPQGWKSVNRYIRLVSQPGNVPPSVHYRKNGIITFDATIDSVFGYMKEGDHVHQAFKSHRLVGAKGNAVTIAAEIFNPDGSSFETTITQKLNHPKSIETIMDGGAFSGARFHHIYTAIGNKTKVDLDGAFPVIPGMSEADELNMIDHFFTVIFNEDAATLKTRSLVDA